jgi:UPF0716 protein FxsA
MRFFLLLFIIIPILEIVLLIQIGGEIGALATIAWLIVAAVIGINLIRLQGVATLIQAREQMAQGKAPAEALANGLLLAFAGVLFVVPGFATDAIAILCLIPALRRLIIGGWLRRLNPGAGGFRGNIYDVEPDIEPANRERVEHNGQVFEGEVESKVERKD